MAEMTQTRRDAFESLRAGAGAEWDVAEAWEVGERVLGLYEVTDVHRAGGMGVVYRVRHLAWETDLAVKSPRAELFRDDDDRQRFTREAETWISLGLHPHVCGCHYVRTLGGVPRVFAEYVPGGSLRDWIRDGRLYAGGGDEALARILDIAVQVAWGLEHAHSHGVVHQDVKPANVLLDDDATAKVTDFGLARARPATAHGAGADSIAVRGGGMTPAYASPEQMAGRDLGRRTDIWSFAVSVLEMFTGEVTWLAGPAAGAALADLHARGAGTVPMPPAVFELLARCLRDDPADRPTAMAELADRLVAVHEAEVGPYHREAPAVAVLRADELNNRGLSLLDLGRAPEAEAALEEARTVDPQHPEATYNLGLLRWRDGRTTDERLVKELEGVHASTGGSDRAQALLAHVHLERRDVASAVPLLERGHVPVDEVRTAYQSRIFQHSRWAAACVSADGRHVVSGDADGVIRVLDAGNGTCVRSFRAHGDILALSLSADGKLLLSAGMDIVNWKWRYTAGLWDTSTGECLRALVHDGSVDSVCLSPDGRLALFGGNDELVWLWELGPNHAYPVGGPARPEASPNTLAHHAVWLSADARFALSGGFVGSVLRLWDVRTGECVREFEGHDRGIRSVCLSADGRLAISGSDDRTVRLWDVDTGRCLRVLEGHSGSVHAVWLDAQARIAVSGGMDHLVRMWDLDTGRCLRTFEGHTENVRSVCLSKDGRRLVTAGGDGTVRVWELTGQHGYLSPLSLCRPRAHTELTRLDRQARALVGKAEEAIAAGRFGDALRALSTARALPGHERSPQVRAAWRRLAPHAVPAGLAAVWQVGTFTEHTGMVKSVWAGPDGRLALTQTWDGTARVWEVETRRCLHTFRSESKVHAACMSGDGSLLLVCHTDGLFELRDTETGGVRNTFSGQRMVNDVVLSTDGRLALSSSLADHTARLWGTGTGRCLRAIDVENGVRALGLTPDAATLLVANGRRAVQAWDIESNECVQTLTGHASDVTALAVTAAGRRVLTGSMDHTVRLWDLESGECLRILTGHEDHVSSVAMTTDGRLGVSGSWDATVRVWDLATGECLRVLAAHDDRVFAVCLSADGRIALSGGGGNGDIHIWEIDRELSVPDAGDR